MNDDTHPDDRAPEPADPGTPLPDLRAECERLRQRIRELEEARQRDAELMNGMLKELHDLQEPAYAWARQWASEDDWKDFKEEDYNIPAEEVLEELEREQGP
jgi:hypothetical protein